MATTKKKKEYPFFVGEYTKKFFDGEASFPFTMISMIVVVLLYIFLVMSYYMTEKAAELSPKILLIWSVVSFTSNVLALIYFKCNKLLWESSQIYSSLSKRKHIKFIMNSSIFIPTGLSYFFYVFVRGGMGYYFSKFSEQVEDSVLGEK